MCRWKAAVSEAQWAVLKSINHLVVLFAEIITEKHIISELVLPFLIVGSDENVSPLVGGQGLVEIELASKALANRVFPTPIGCPLFRCECGERRMELFSIVILDRVIELWLDVLVLEAIAETEKDK